MIKIASSASSIENAVRWFRDRGAFCCISPYSNRASDALHPREKPLLEGLCLKRIREFSMGRYLARKCFAAAGIPDGPVLMGQFREPLWPEAVCGTISHSAGFYAAAVADKGVLRSIGLDLEDASRPVSEGAYRLICTEEEQRMLRKSSWNPEAARVAVFSAKEAFYKLLYPLVGERFSFDGARLTGVFPDRFDFELTLDFSREFFPGWKTGVAVFTDGNHVVTCAALV